VPTRILKAGPGICDIGRLMRGIGRLAEEEASFCAGVKVGGMQGVERDSHGPRYGPACGWKVRCCVLKQVIFIRLPPPT
jgi:hypothetical protein